MTPSITLPEFCPRPSCPFYDRRLAASTVWYQRFGSYETKCRGTIRRFRCTTCGKTCSTQTFSIHYWTHSTWNFRLLHQSVCSCAGLRQFSRYRNYSFRVVENRNRHLARNCLALLDLALRHLSLCEDVAMDGFESYTRSQYFPNNITCTVGGRSEYLLGAVHTLLRRKGRMRPQQKRRRAQIERYWKPRRGALAEDCRVLLQDQAAMIDRCSRKRRMILWSDEHRAYPGALQKVPLLRTALEEGRLVHRTVSSRAARTTHNPLFPVNYVDRQIRKNMGEHVRETVKQGREVNCQMERMAIFMVDHNFLTPHRIRDGVNLDQLATRAEEAGIDRGCYQGMLDRLYTHRFIYGHTSGSREWQRRIWKHRYENPPAVEHKSGEVSRTCVGVPPERIAAHFLA